MSEFEDWIALEKSQIATEKSQELSEACTRKANKIKNTPHCPTCGSTKIRRISSTEKVVNTMAFGFFGNKRKKQFECLNPKCKYKW